MILLDPQCSKIAFNFRIGREFFGSAFFCLDFSAQSMLDSLNLADFWCFQSLLRIIMILTVTPTVASEPRPFHANIRTIPMQALSIPALLSIPPPLKVIWTRPFSARYSTSLLVNAYNSRQNIATPSPFLAAHQSAQHLYTVMQVSRHITCNHSTFLLLSSLGGLSSAAPAAYNRPANNDLTTAPKTRPTLFSFFSFHSLVGWGFSVAIKRFVRLM